MFGRTRMKRLVDRLLASPAYGERWGRHWLDLARYADSNGFTRDFGREIWKYREWVIAAINENMPFDQFTIEQFAGDMLPDATLSQQIATGFHRNTLINEEGGTDKEQFRIDAVADRVATTGVVYLGLTLGCARCHQHKFDPISQREYYQLFSFLNNCEEPEIDAPSPRQIELGVVRDRDAIRTQIAAREQSLEALEGEIAKQQTQWESAVTPEFYRTLPGPTQAALDAEPAKRDDAQQELVRALYKTTEHARTAFPLVGDIAKLKSQEPVIPTAMVLRERKETRTTHIHRRGNFLDKADEVSPQVPAILHPLRIEATATRLDFARWLVDPTNPLTPRVVVNRYWQRFFGRGIVETENDFGTQGIPPTHPQLLDWLAVEFVESGWNVKQMHRLIVTSATYRQASHQRTDLIDIDPQNKRLAQQSRIRLDAEIIRDCALSAALLLSKRVGGPSVNPPQPEGIYAFTQDKKPWNTDVGENRFRRGMYTYFWRSSPYPALVVFDAPNANVTCTRRVRSNTPLQSLTLANDIQFVECARSLAEHVLSESTIQDQTTLLFQHCLSRSPMDWERQRLTTFILEQRQLYEQSPAAAKALLGARPTDTEGRIGGADCRRKSSDESRRVHHTRVMQHFPRRDRPEVAMSHDVLLQTRRHFFHDCRMGLGTMALGSLLGADGVLQEVGGAEFQGTRKPHHLQRAKHVIFLFMAGGPSQLELFEPKPKLQQLDGQVIPASFVENQRFAFIKKDAKLLGTRRKFARHGESGHTISECLPHIASISDEIAVIRSMKTDVFNHGPAKFFMNTGFNRFGRPSMGAWVTYGIGSESSDLPGFVVLQSGPRGPRGGAPNWGSGFLPTTYQGVPFRGKGAPILNLESPAGISRNQQQDFIHAVNDLNRMRLDTTQDPEIATRIAAYEMAYRMQSSAPELMDLSDETQETMDLYGGGPVETLLRQQLSIG